MSEHDESLIDKVKNALGMGDRDREEHEERHMESGVPGDRPLDDRSDTWGVDGATQATGREGATGGTGASAAMGGAGASGPVGATPDPSLAEAEEAAGADAREVRTEYEMGQEVDPEHETRAESGFSAPTRGESASGESPFRDADEDEDETARR